MNESATPRRNVTARLVTFYVALGQVSFAFFIAVCVALHPGLVVKADEGGMSNYGVHLKTFAPYTLALATPAVCSWVAANYARRAAGPRHYAAVLRTYAVLITITLLSTYGYTLSTPAKDVHIAVGIVIALFETAASWWLYRLTRGHRLLVYILLVGFTLEVVTFFGALHLLFVTQLLTGGVFAIFLVVASRLVVSEPR